LPKDLFFLAKESKGAVHRGKRKNSSIVRGITTDQMALAYIGEFPQDNLKYVRRQKSQLFSPIMFCMSKESDKSCWVGYIDRVTLPVSFFK
jgi:hypothetical protein